MGAAVLAHVVRSAQMHLTAVIFNWKELKKLFPVRCNDTSTWTSSKWTCGRLKQTETAFIKLLKNCQSSENYEWNFSLLNVCFELESRDLEIRKKPGFSLGNFSDSDSEMKVLMKVGANPRNQAQILTHIQNHTLYWSFEVIEAEWCVIGPVW